MTEKCYRDEDGLVIDSDFMIFDENSDDIIDETYINDDWFRSPEVIYIEIVKENTKLYNDYIKGKF